MGRWSRCLGFGFRI